MTTLPRKPTPAPPLPTAIAARPSAPLPSALALAFAITLPLVLALALATALTAATTSAQPAAPRPVLLVHGWQGLEARGFDCADGVLGYDEVGAPDGISPRAAGEFGALAARIATERPVFAARWTTSRSRTIPLEQAGGCLAAQIAEVRARTGAADVDVIGHSMGGLVARAYVEGRAVAQVDGRDGASTSELGITDAAPVPYRGDVARIVTLGTPHTGVAPEVLVRLFALFNLANARHGFLPCDADPGTCQLANGPMADWNAAAPPNADVTHALLAGARWTWTSWLLPGPDDGLITLPSAAAADTALAEISEGSAFRVPEAHAALFSSRHHYVEGRRTIPCVAGLLGLEGVGACDEPTARTLRTAGGALPPRPEDAPVLGYGPLVGGEIGSEAPEPLRTTIQVDPIRGADHAQRLSVAAGWGAGVGRAALRLTTPDGRRIEAATVAGLMAGGAYTEVLRPDGSGAAVLDLPGAPAGAWQAELAMEAGGAAEDRGAGPASTAASAPAAIFAVLATPLRLRVEAEDGRPGGGTVWAELSHAGEPIAWADLELRQRAAEGIRTIRMTPAGNGRYWATLPSTPLGTASQLDVVARGTTDEGWAFARQATHVLPARAAGQDGAGPGEPGGGTPGEMRARAWLPWAVR